MYDIYNGHYEIGFNMKNRDSYRGTIYNSASRALVILQDPESLVCRPWYDDASEWGCTGFSARVPVIVDDNVTLPFSFFVFVITLIRQTAQPETHTYKND
jgi:hypothetical protein